MKLEAYAEFRGDFPHDLDESDDGEFLQTPGWYAAEAIQQLLKGLGYDAMEPYDCGDHGWGVGVQHKRQWFWLELSIGDNYYFRTEESRRLSRIFRDPGFVSPEILTRLNAEMARDPRFDRVRWFTKKDFLSGWKGSKDPIIQKT